jgi:hypothetical protein
LGLNVTRHNEIYVFRCGTSALFALTTDRSGCTLPTSICEQSGWQFERVVRLRESNRYYEYASATLAAIAKNGFHLVHSAIHPLPMDSTDAATLEDS